MSNSIEIAKMAFAGMSRSEQAAFAAQVLGSEIVAAPGRILKAVKVSRLLDCSLTALANWRREGLLVPVVLPGRARALGYREADVEAFIRGQKAKE